jgi:PKD repeat protein
MQQEWEIRMQARQRPFRFCKNMGDLDARDVYLPHQSGSNRVKYDARGKIVMRNLYLSISLAVAVVASIRISQPCGESIQSQSPQEAYQNLFNRKLAEMPKMSEVSQWEKRMRPDMFHLFDKLQRMDPRTGEVPADGYTRAFAYIQETWGNQLSTEQTGNALLWQERGPGGVGGRTRALLWDPNDTQHKAVFAGGVGGGLWRTQDVTVANPSWVNVSPVFSNVAVTCIGYDASNPLLMYYGTGEGWFNADAIRGAGVWKSTNGGLSWEVLPSSQNSQFYYCQDIAVASGVLYVGTKNGLWRSIDGGQTFAKGLGSGTGLGGDFITDLEVAGNGDLYATINGGGIYKSPITQGSNQGSPGSWSRLTMNFPAGYDRIELAVGKSNSNYLYAVSDVNQAASDIYRSTNGGTSWSTTTAQPNNGNDFTNGQAWYDLTLEVDPNDHLVAFVGGIDQYRTTNGGSSWTKLTAAYGGTQTYMHPDQHNTAVNPFNSNQVVFTNDGGVYYSSNKGSTPSPKNATYNVTQFYSLAIDPRSYSDVLIGGTQDNGSILVNQTGIGNGIDLTGGDGSYCAINRLYPDTMFTTSQYETLYRTRNGGGTFASLTNFNLDESNTLFINPIEIDPANPNVLYQASTSLWRHANSSSGSASGWTQVTTNLNTQITAIAPATTPANLVYFSAGGTIYRLPNANSANFTTVPGTVNPSGAGSGYVNCILVNPNDGNHIIVTYSSFGVAKRVIECRNANLGANAVWKDLTGNLPDIPCNWAAFEPTNPNGILVGTDMGVFRCADITQFGSNVYWSPQNQGLGLPRVSMIKTKYSNNSVHIATHGRGFFSTFSYNQPPVANFGTGNTVACGGTIQFFDSTSNAPSSWTWDFGDGSSSTLQSPVHTYSASGTYTVTLTASNAIGSDAATSSIQVTVLPPAVAFAGTDVSGCPGDSLQLQASGGVNYVWTPSAGLTNANVANPVAIITANRTYVVRITDANGCEDTDTLVVSLLPAPSVWAGQDQTITIPGDSVQLQGTGAASYSWSPAAGLSCTNCPNPKASPASTTVYTCTGFGANGCSRSDNMTVFVSLVGVDQALQNGFRLEGLFPNPASKSVRVNFSVMHAAPVRFGLTDLAGRVLIQSEPMNWGVGSHSIAWDIERLPAGIYFVRMEQDGNFDSQKLVIKQ